MKYLLETQKVMEFESPFYEPLDVVLEPILCSADNIQKYASCENRFSAPDDLQKSFYEEGSELDKKIILKLIKVDSTNVKFCEFLGSSFVIHVNDRQLMTIPSLTDAYIDITSDILKNRTSDNNLKITWINIPHDVRICLFLVENKLDTLIYVEILWQQEQQIDKTSSLLAKYFEDDIESLSCSILDPLTFKKLENPGRGKNCQHLQCFDMLNFLALNRISGSWKCPICLMKVKVEDLEHDKHLLSLLSMPGMPDGCRSIKFYKNGWKWLDPNSPIETANQPLQDLISYRRV